MINSQTDRPTNELSCADEPYDLCLLCGICAPLQAQTQIMGHAVEKGGQPVVYNYRRITSGDRTLTLPTGSDRDPLRRVHNFTMGVDIDLSARKSVTALVSGYQNKFIMDARTEVTVAADGTPITRSESRIDKFNRWRHLMGSIGLQHSLGDNATAGIDLDYVLYRNKMPTENLNTTINLASGQVAEELLSSGKETPLSIMVAKSDYTRSKGSRWEVGGGLKMALSRFSNTMTFSEAARAEWEAAISAGTKGELREDVYAGYVTGNFQVSDATSVELGLRYELTDTRLEPPPWLVRLSATGY